MASYNIVFKPSVEKDLRSLPKSVIGRVLRHIEVLRKNPFPRQSVKLAGAEQLYRIRIGDYRVVYAVDKEAQEIIVQYIRHRREVYRG
jgi:mRNA interferase RelE/StbE